MREEKTQSQPYNPAKESFMVGESSLDFILDRPLRQPIGIILLCLAGRAEIAVNMNQCVLTENMQAIIFPNEICTLSGKTADFNVLFFSFTDQMFKEAAYRIGPDFFGYLQEHFYTTLPEHAFESSQNVLRMAEVLYNDNENKFRERMAVNILQNYLLNSHDKISRYHAQEVKESDRKNKLFKQFVTLVHDHSTTNREVSFYADKLSISTRYLSAIAQANCQKPAKEFIDNCVIQEIKLLLHSTDLSIQEIADRMNFPDQSYLGRYFKKQTGISPKEYRKR